MRRILATGVAGLALAWVLALALGDGVSAAAEVVALAAGASIVLFLTGAVLLRVLRGRSLAAHLAAVILTTMFGVAAGVLVASWRMFISQADTKAMLVILLSVGTVGAVGALAMAARLNRAVVAVGDMAAALDHHPIEPIPYVPMPTRELSALALQLHEVGERLQESITRERALESSRRELVAWVSHDLRTPLAGIRATVEALEDGIVTDVETVRRYHETIRIEVERLSGMVDDLFRLSRIHAGLTGLDMEDASLTDLISDALSLAAPTADARGIRLTGQVPDGGLYVHLAATEFFRVLRNLLDNALRHTPEGGEVTVRAEAWPAEAVVTVRDGCGGIPAGVLERVFDVGYRGDDARTPGLARAGLGLAIAHGLLAAQGGSIHVDNEPIGCCFTVRVPTTRITR